MWFSEELQSPRVEAMGNFSEACASGMTPFDVRCRLHFRNAQPKSMWPLHTFFFALHNISFPPGIVLDA